MVKTSLVTRKRQGLDWVAGRHIVQGESHSTCHDYRWEMADGKNVKVPALLSTETGFTSEPNPNRITQKQPNYEQLSEIAFLALRRILSRKRTSLVHFAIALRRFDVDCDGVALSKRPTELREKA